ncbi:hypothetical protein GCM10011504_33190 [Siccirubricoccus deserti]|uniref:Uncharacterized protein n=1 Tax=Siccirubricoccus deserti TaxID=2013562 RepID=A0A9X0QZD4_9PROT|nr:hypothetical protein [Siccirubricoccus deserti]MBC4016814.1 hypothetical protein [Siccirubricoccus deserti]GGC52128.1 hypothetical protein GCM10011504_33190 [Siccirubricoccus deserti]
MEPTATRPSRGLPDPHGLPARAGGLTWLRLCAPAPARNLVVAWPMGFAVLTVLTIAAVLLLSPYPPLQDFIEWIYQAEVLARLGDDGALPGVRLAGYPVPNSLFQLLLGGFALVMPAPAAGRLFLVAYAAAALLLAAGLARRYQPEAAAPFTCILLISFFFNAPFWNGYGNYQTGLLLLAGWYLLPEARRISPWLILAYGLLLFFAHAMVFAAFAAILGVEALARRRVLPTALALAPAMLLFAWYVLGKEAPPTAHQPGQVEEASSLALKAYTLAKIGPYHNFVFDSGGDAVLRPLVYSAGSAVNLLYAAALLAAIAWGGRTAWRRRSVPWAAVAAAAGLGLLFLFLPSRIQSVVVNPGERLMYPALLLLLLALPLPRQPARLLGGSIAVLALSLTGLGLGPRPWDIPVSPAGPAAAREPRQVLFWHRPTAFTCKWQEMRRAEAKGEAPQLPITFRTSLLVGAGGAECDKDWERRDVKR